MKRSLINNSIKTALNVIKDRYYLPPFAYWDMQKWQNNKDNIELIKKNMIGWDVTDFGNGDFENVGAVLFTVRNGDENDINIGTPYAEKLIVLKGGQRLPTHMHKKKCEDIINRGLGVFEIKLFNTDKNGNPDFESDVEFYCDSIKRTAKANEVIRILPGESITLRPFCYHSFWAAKDCEYAIIGEVSSVNDDNEDNCFAEEVNRFSVIEEDEAVLFPLCNEYNTVIK